MSDYTSNDIVDIILVGKMWSFFLTDNTQSLYDLCQQQHPVQKRQRYHTGRVILIYGPEYLPNYSIYKKMV